MAASKPEGKEYVDCSRCKNDYPPERQAIPPTIIIDTLQTIP